MSRQTLVDTTSSEWLKFRTVRSTIYSLIVTIGLCVGIGALIAFARGSREVYVFDPTRVSLQGFSLAEISAGVIGVLIITSEYATGSIRSTLSATPRRLSVLTAKSIVLFTSMLIVGEVCAFVSFFVGQAILRGQHATSASLSDPGALRGVVLAGLSLSLLAVFAMGLGAMLRHTAGAISVYVALLLVVFLLIEALPADWRDHAAKFMPEVLTASMRAATSVGSNFSSYSPLTSTLILAVYALASFAGGALVLARRDA